MPHVSAHDCACDNGVDVEPRKHASTAVTYGHRACLHADSTTWL